MKRAIAIAVSICTAVAWSLATPPKNAWGHGADVCVGHGLATTANPLFYPFIGPTAVGAFDVDLNATAGGCVLAPAGTATGRFTDHMRVPPDVADLSDLGNFCGHSEGNLAILGHEGHWIANGTLFVFVGGQSGLNGVANVVPDVFPIENCVLTGADEFLFTYAFVLA